MANPIEQTPSKRKFKSTSQWADVWRRFRKNRNSVIGIICLTAIIVLVLSASLIYDYKEDALKQNIKQRLESPFSEDYIFGSDDLGRDVAARLLFGGRKSLLIGFSSVLISLIFGTIIGAVSGYFGGAVDNLIMRVIDIVMAIPMTMLAIVIVAALGPSLINMVIALSIAQIPVFARVVRGSILSEKDNEYIEAAKAIGCNDFQIIFSHLLPNCLSPIIVQIAIRSATAITNAAALSFLGLGIQPPTPEWGNMLSTGRTYIRDYPFLTFIPGMAIMLTILSLNLLGDGLRDSLDPKLR